MNLPTSAINRFRYLLALLALLLVSTAAMAQNTIKGVLEDADKGEAVPFAHVYLDGTKHWTTTDINGYFIITKIPDGEYTLKTRYAGYEEYNETLTLKHQTIVRNIPLRSAVTRLKEVVVSSNKSEERKVMTQVSVEKVTASQIQQMPSIGGQADLAQYLQVLPGVNSTGDQGGQLYIRGGNKKRHTGKVGLNTFGANLILEGPLKRESNSSPSTVTYLVTAKNSFLSKSSQALYSYIDGGLPFDFLDTYGKIYINSGRGSKVNFFAFRFDDRVNNYMALADFHWTNFGAGTNFALMTGSSSLIDGTVAYSKYKVNLDDASGSPKYSSIGGFNVSLGITNTMGNNKLRYGFGIEGYTTEYRYTNAYGVRQAQDENTSQLSAYATYHINSGKWLIDPGIRFLYYASLSEPSLEPRLAAKFNATDKLRFKLATGLYSQIILDARSDHDIVNLFNGFLTGSGQLNMPSVYQNEPVESCVQRAQHIVFGVEYDAIEHLTLNMEFYYKNFSHLLGMNHNQFFDRSDPAYAPGGTYEQPQYLMTDFIIEKGRAAGVDFSACYDIERLYLWATYSLGFVSRTDELQTYHPHYDRRHTVNLLATYAIGDERQWELSGRWSMGSGFPLTLTSGIYESLQFPDGISSDYLHENGEMGITYGELYAGRLPMYHRLDLGVKRKFSFGKRGLLELSLSVTNVYDRNNIFYFDRITGNRIDQLPILLCGGVTCSF